MLGWTTFISNTYSEMKQHNKFHKSGFQQLNSDWVSVYSE